MATINMHMKFKIEIPKQTWLRLRKPCRLQTDGRTDGQTDGQGESSIPPPPPPPWRHRGHHDVIVMNAELWSIRPKVRKTTSEICRNVCNIAAILSRSKCFNSTFSCSRIHRSKPGSIYMYGTRLCCQLFGGIIVVATNSCGWQSALPGQWNNGAFTFPHTSNKTVLQQQILLFRLSLFSYFNCTSELLLNNLARVLWPSRTRVTDELNFVRDFVKYRFVIWNKIGYIDVELSPAFKKKKKNMINTQCIAIVVRLMKPTAIGFIRFGRRRSDRITTARFVW